MKLLQNDNKIYLVPNNESDAQRGIPVELVPETINTIDFEAVLAKARVDINKKALATQTLLNETMIKNTLIAYLTMAINDNYS